MTFVGKDQTPAPKLKDAILSRSQLESAYEQCTQVCWDLLQTESQFDLFNLSGKSNHIFCKCLNISITKYILLKHQNFHFFISDDENNVREM